MSFIKKAAYGRSSPISVHSLSNDAPAHANQSVLNNYMNISAKSIPLWHAHKFMMLLLLSAAILLQIVDAKICTVYADPGQCDGMFSYFSPLSNALKAIISSRTVEFIEDAEIDRILSKRAVGSVSCDSQRFVNYQ